MLVGVRQKREKSGALNRCSQLALVTRFGPGIAAGHDLTGLCDEAFKRIQILVVNFFYT